MSLHQMSRLLRLRAARQLGLILCFGGSQPFGCRIARCLLFLFALATGIGRVIAGRGFSALAAPGLLLRGSCLRSSHSSIALLLLARRGRITLGLCFRGLVGT